MRQYLPILINDMKEKILLIFRKLTIENKRLMLNNYYLKIF